MDYKKSIKVGIAMRGITLQELADEMGISRQWLHKRMATQPTQITDWAETAEALMMPLSEFIKLGESK